MKSQNKVYIIHGKRIGKPPTTNIISMIMEDSVRPRRSHAAWITTYSRSDAPIRKHRPESSDSPYSSRTLRAKAQASGKMQANLRGISCGETVREYLIQTSMHGLRYVGETELHWLERGFWAVSFLLAMLTSFYFITNLYMRWENDPVIMSLSPRAMSLTQMPFPALTICNMNRAKASIVRDIRSNTDEQQREREISLLDGICVHANGNSARNESKVVNSYRVIENFMVKVTQPCHEMIKSCLYAGEELDCYDIFNTALTDEGMCCSFNRVKRDDLYRNPRDLSELNVTFPNNTVDWTPEKGYPPGTPPGTIPRRPRGAGRHLGFTLVLDAQVDDYYCSSTASVGFKMVMHSPVETPKIAGYGLAMTPGLEFQVPIRPSISHATDQLKSIPSSKRQCKFAHETQLGFYRTYTQKNCALECEANFTLSECGCVLAYMPKDNYTSICGRSSENCAFRAKNTMEMRLVDDSSDDSDNATASNATATASNTTRPKCDCLPACSEINYEVKSSSSRLLPFDQVAEKKYLANITDTEYYLKNMAVVHLYFTQTQFTIIEKGELFGFTEFLSNTGGLLGLFMGFSALSLIEILYNLSLKLWCTIARNRKDSTAEHRVVERGTDVVPLPFMK